MLNRNIIRIPLTNYFDLTSGVVETLEQAGTIEGLRNLVRNGTTIILTDNGRDTSVVEIRNDQFFEVPIG